MTSPKAIEFLTKQLNIQKEIVTFRWLSRALSIHVNMAKNELATFYASSRFTEEPVYATYILIGEVTPVNAEGSYRDDGEDGMNVDDITSESVATRKILLVGEDELETAKAQFARMPSVHIYSLSPAAIKDAFLLAPIADRTRPDDVSKGKAFNETIGIVVGADVKVGHTNKVAAAMSIKMQASASSSKLPPPAAAGKKPNSSDKGKAPEKVKLDDKKKGTLDWSKAKTKANKEKDDATAKKTKDTPQRQQKPKLKTEEAKPKVKKNKSPKETVKEVEDSKVFSRKDAPEDPRRGIKRPSTAVSLYDSEDNKPSPPVKRRISTSSSGPSSNVDGVKIRNGVLFSDDEEELKPKVARKGKGRVLVSDEEEDNDPSVRAMMDLDDSKVIENNRAEGQKQEEDAEMLSDSEPIPVRPKAKRKPKKVIPVGKNGLPKKRVVKSKRSKNAKGYTVTEDYSSYESVSESEQAPIPSDTDRNQKKGAKKEKKVNASAAASGTSSDLKRKGSTKFKAEPEEQSSKSKNEPDVPETSLELKKPSFESGNSKPTAGTNGKGNLMSYFTKK
ncbi:hypothetical protein K439DRAFT_1641573 [Ramaria rubella]|nr:hypothetical protein K439DRAFT_1641573 [Ramaria rubella]